VHALTVNNVHLDQVLAPIAKSLDQCWWFLGGAGMSFPSIRPPTRIAPPPKTAKTFDDLRAQYDRADWERYSREMQAANEEYSNWLDTSTDDRIGKPGFFARYAAGMDGTWAMYYASDADQLPMHSFRSAVQRFDGVWFDPPPEDLPSDICLVTRDIDSAYLDLFFRDEWMFRTVWGYLEQKGMNPRPYKKLVIDEKHRRK
jgi:hypothetical protein